MPKSSSLLAFALAASLLSVGSGRAEARPIRVLFIGNSYTAFNGMTDTVAAMGRDLGYAIRPTVRTFARASFMTHARSKETLRVIASERWDVAVLQDYSLNPGLSPEIVREFQVPDARRLVRAIRKNDPATRIIYYATWGHRDGDEWHCELYHQVCDFDGHSVALQRGYRQYQQATGGSIAQVGANWRRIVHDDPSRRPFMAHALWLNDGSHPSQLGSYLAAATILRQIIGAPVSAARYAPQGVPFEDAAYLRRVVDSQAGTQGRH